MTHSAPAPRLPGHWQENADVQDVRLFGAPVPESPDELMARARYRDDLGDIAQAEGLYEEARRHWERAAEYRARAA